jgi:hypothetical protein
MSFPLPSQSYGLLKDKETNDNNKQTRTRDVTQAVEQLLCKCEVLSSNPSLTKKKKKKKKRVVCASKYS